MNTKMRVLLLLSFFCSDGFGKELTILSDPWPPYHYPTPSGEITGMATEVVEAVLEDMQIAHRIEIMPFMRAQKELENGNADAFYVATFNEKRQEYAHFPEEPIARSKWVFFVRKKDRDRIKISSYEDLKPLRVGVVKEYAYTDEFWRALDTHNIHHAQVGKDVQSFDMLEKGRIDIVPASYFNGLYIIDENNWGDKIVPLETFVIKESGLYMIWNKQKVDKAFVHQFSETLKTFKQSQQYTNTINHYLTSPSLLQ